MKVTFASSPTVVRQMSRNSAWLIVSLLSLSQASTCVSHSVSFQLRGVT